MFSSEQAGKEQPAVQLAQQLPGAHVGGITLLLPASTSALASAFISSF